MWNYAWPILIVVASNTFYHICSKATSQTAPPMAALTATYLVAAAVSFIIYLVSGQHTTLLADFGQLNIASIGLGIAVIGLEFGFIMVYRAGWDISVGPMVANVSLCIALLILGALAYGEQITLKKLIGAALCIAGIVVITK